MVHAFEIDESATLHVAFEKAADRWPDRCAVREPEHSWTYREIEALANGVAHRLLDEGGAGSEVITVLLENGGQSLAAAMGVLKSGKCFVGLSVSDPPARLCRQQEHTRARFLLTNRRHCELAARIASSSTRVIVVDDVEASLRPTVAVPPDALCMVVYTSGSTGTPKGVSHSHRNQLFSAGCLRRSLNLSEMDRMTLFGSLAGGASTTQALAALMSGASVYPYDLKSAGARDLARWMERERLTIIHTAPTTFRYFVRNLDEPHEFPDIRIVRLGGEQMLEIDVELFKKTFRPEAVLINTLGITEVGQVCIFTVDRNAPIPSPIPVGSAFPGQRLHIVDDAGGNLPPGEIGELVIESRYLSSGYFQRDDLTRERFTFDGENPELSRYRTGDRAFLAPDGVCTLLGRKDQQAKIGGLTVRVGEIESALLKHPDVQESALQSRADGNEGSRLVAYVVLRRGATIKPSDLQSYLASHLPPHMVPSVFELMDALPRTAGGKVDQRALAKAASKSPRSEVEPSPLERALLIVWHDLLGPIPISVNDNFFALGAESLVAVDLVTLLSDKLGEHVHMIMLHEAPTIAEQARFLEARHPGGVARWLGLTPVASGKRPGLVLAGLKTTGSYPPFFCVQGAGTDAFGLSDIAKSVDREQPFYSFHAPGLDGQSLPLKRIEDMASRYIEAIKTIQPQGPYYLGGSSFGGKVAFEMAQQLNARDERVAVLALLDAWGPGYPASRPVRGLRRRLLLLVRWFLPIGQREELTWRNFRLGLHQRRARLVARLALFLNVPMKPLKPMLRFACVIESCFRAQRAYQIKPYQGHAVLIRVEHQPPRELYVEDPLLGWGGLVQGGLNVIDTPGRHGEHERYPYARPLGQKLQRVLDFARSNQ